MSSYSSTANGGMLFKHQRAVFVASSPRIRPVVVAQSHRESYCGARFPSFWNPRLPV